MTCAGPPKGRLLLLDGHNLLFRSFSSLPRTIVDPHGRPINAVHGLISTVLRFLREEEPIGLVVAFDVPEVPTFRHRLFPLYQAQRGPLGGADADNFQWQTEQAQAVLRHVGVPALTAPGYEADDILGTIAAANAAGPSLIVSTDRDIQQLVTEGVHVLVPGRNEIELGPADVEARLGLPPRLVVDWKALAGDPSDNIPGVSGIGDKTARKLLMEYGSIDAVFAHLDRLPPRLSRALVQQQDDVFLYRNLVRIRTDAPIDMSTAWTPAPVALHEQRPGQILAELGLRRPAPA